MNAVTIPFQQARSARFFLPNLHITHKMINILAVSAILSSLAGFGMVIAAWDGATIGIVVGAIGSLISAAVAGLIAVMNARTKNRIEEMKVQMETQRALATMNNRALGDLHNAIAQNTVETVKSTAASDQVKQRVEQLEQKLPQPTETQKIQ